MIDWSRVEELQSEIGAEDFAEVVELFLDEVEEVIERLRSTPDISRLEEDLHFLKGSALNLGFRAFSVLCQSGESASAVGKAASVDLGPILDCFDSSKIEFTGKLEANRAA
jgi:HPt (histidine-containing phosphotransfer) domain-containing protein